MFEARLFYIILLSPLFGIAQKLSVSESLHFSKHALFEETNLFLHRKTVSIGLSISFGDYARGNYNGETPYLLPFSITEYENYYYSQYKYSSTNRGFGFGFRIENEWKLNSKKGAPVLGVELKKYYIEDNVKLTLVFPSRFTKPPDQPQTIVREISIKHESWSAGIYFGYKYNINRKLKVIVQLNMPYYYPVRTKVYFANQSEFPMVALEPNLSVGINYIIKKR